MAAHNETGKRGEELAAAYFRERGFTLLHQNWRTGKLEIDIIASKDATLHFIEVKTATTLMFGYPEEKADRKKLKFVIDAAEVYLHENPEWKRVQFDILSVTLLAGKDAEYFLIEDVYE